jgi:hypothetical protein
MATQNFLFILNLSSIVNTFIILHAMKGALKIRDLYEIFKFQNFEYVVLFLDPKLLIKIPQYGATWQKRSRALRI